MYYFTLYICIHDISLLKRYQGLRMRPKYIKKASESMWEGWGKSRSFARDTQNSELLVWPKLQKSHSPSFLPSILGTVWANMVMFDHIWVGVGPTKCPGGVEGEGRWWAGSYDSGHLVRSWLPKWSFAAVKRDVCRMRTINPFFIEITWNYDLNVEYMFVIIFSLQS